MASLAPIGLILSTIGACIFSFSATDNVPFNDLSKPDFPSGFVFGTASSAYQYEGAWNVSGKGPSIWDTFTARYPERIKDKSDGRVAIDTYHRYKDDVGRMKHMGVDAYRFSISWTRILPNGRRCNKPNAAGIEYYNNLIDELLRNDITPFVTIFHWDLPQALENDGGFLNESIVVDFGEYADLCFATFGDRVKHWITINEPWSYSVFGYAYGTFPPNRCSKGTKSVALDFSVGRYARYLLDNDCHGGDSGTEPYRVSHHLLLAHATAVQIYREKYQATQKGEIGISLNTEWMVPYDKTSEKDQAAADRALAFMYGWFMEPLNSGMYPSQMVTHVKGRLPNFTKEQSELVKGSFDFIGLNYYTAAYAADTPCSDGPTKIHSYLTDACVRQTKVKNGIPIGNETGSNWLFIYPEGIRDTLLYTKAMYNDPPVYITENGASRPNPEFNLTDPLRTYYYQQHLLMLQNVTRSGSGSVKGYFIWSLLDNFEWLDGYSVRFGIIQVDYDSIRTLSHETSTLIRTYKSSAEWFRNFLLRGKVVRD